MHIVQKSLHKPKTLSNLLILLALIILILLGNWQMIRRNQKLKLIQTIENSINSNAKFLKNKPNTYSKILIKGHFIPNNHVFLYGRKSAESEKNGYYLMSIFESINAKKYLVSRGWIPYNEKDQITSMLEYEKHETIEAITMPGEKQNFMAPKNDLTNNIWFSIDLDMAKTHLGITEENFYLIQIHSANTPLGIRPYNISLLTKIRNDHLEYAITWYSLALCLVAMYFIKNYKIKSNNCKSSDSSETK